MKSVLFALVLFLSAIGGTTAVAGGEPLLVSGSKIVIQSYRGDPVVSGGVKFRDTEQKEYLLRIEADGSRNYLVEDGSIHHGNSSDHTTLIWKGKPIPEAKRFVRLPQGRRLQPGMEWDASVVGGTSCGEMPFEYRAVSAQGRPFELEIDGVSRSVETIEIVYRASVRICPSPDKPTPIEKWERKQVLLFAPSLNEIVESTTISYNWRATRNLDEETRFVDSAHGWRIKEIRTRN